MPLYSVDKNGELYEVNAHSNDGSGTIKRASNVDEGSLVFGAQSVTELKNRERLNALKKQKYLDKQKKKAEKILARKKAENERSLNIARKRQEFLKKQKELNLKNNIQYLQARKQTLLGRDFTSLMGDPLQGFGAGGKTLKDVNLKGEGSKEIISENSAYGESTLYSGELGWEMKADFDYLKQSNAYDDRMRLNGYDPNKLRETALQGFLYPYCAHAVVFNSELKNYAPFKSATNSYSERMELLKKHIQTSYPIFYENLKNELYRLSFINSYKNATSTDNFNPGIGAPVGFAHASYALVGMAHTRYPTKEEMVKMLTKYAGANISTDESTFNLFEFIFEIIKFVALVASTIASLPEKLISHIPVLKDIYKGINDLTGGGLSSLIKVGEIVANVAAGNFAGALSNLKSLALSAKIGGVALSDGLASVALGVGATELKKSALGSTPLGRALIESASGAAISNASTAVAVKAGEDSKKSGADPYDQASSQASAQAAANTGALAGASIAVASSSPTMQTVLEEQGKKAAKEALVAQVVNKTGIDGALIAESAAVGLDLASEKSSPVEAAKKTSAAIMATISRDSVTVASNIDASLAEAKKAVEKNPENLEAAASKAISIAESNPADLLMKLFNEAQAAMQKAMAHGYAAEAAKLAASNIKNFIEQPNTVKNVVTGQTYPAVNAQEIQSRVSEADLTANQLSSSEVQANISNNARRLNVHIDRVPNLKIPKEERLANAEAIKNTYASKIVQLNLKSVAASEAYISSKALVDELIAAGSKTRKAIDETSDLETKQKLKYNLDQIDLELLQASNDLNIVQASAFKTLLDADLKKSQVSLKIAAAEEGRYYPNMTDPAHPMLVWGSMKRGV